MEEITYGEQPATVGFGIQVSAGRRMLVGEDEYGDQ
jgi:hypothetical protein